MPQHNLFCSVSVFDVMQRRQHELKEALAKLPASSLSDEGLPEGLAIEFGLSVPRLDVDAKHATTEEVRVDVSGERRFIFGDTGPSYAQATQVTIHIPYEGDGGLFDVRPSTFSSLFPVGEYDDRELRLAYRIIEGRDIGPEIEKGIHSIRQHLTWLESSVIQLHGQLRDLANTQIAQARQRQTAQDAVLSKLNIPLRAAESKYSFPLAEKAAPARRVTPHKVERWDVFISHASEDKDEIARPLADALMAKGFKVWYDDLSLKVGDSLRKSIDKGLAHSKFGVVILSRRFFEKHWPQQELNGLATREVNGQKVILPVWHKVGFDEVRNYSPTLADRLAVPTELGLPEVVKRILSAME
jgi:hypothetical protein